MAGNLITAHNGHLLRNATSGHLATKCCCTRVCDCAPGSHPLTLSVTIALASKIPAPCTACPANGFATSAESRTGSASGTYSVSPYGTSGCQWYAAGIYHFFNYFGGDTTCANLAGDGNDWPMDLYVQLVGFGDGHPLWKVDISRRSGLGPGTSAVPPSYTPPFCSSTTQRISAFYGEANTSDCRSSTTVSNQFTVLNPCAIDNSGTGCNVIGAGGTAIITPLTWN